MGPLERAAAVRAAGPTPALRRELRFLETASVSIGVMAPTLAMSVTGVVAAATLGRAAPLAFVLAGLGVLLTNVAAVRHLRRRAAHEVVLPVDGALIAAYVLFRNVWPLPAAPYSFLPGVVAAWLVAGVVLTLRPDARRRRLGG
jgi:hypothetical protein